MRKLCLSVCLAWMSVAAAAQAGHLIINQVYGGGGNAGAPYKNDFIEIFNPSPASITFANWSIQYTSAATTGTWSDVATISGTIPAGGYFLVQLQGGAVGADLPVADASFATINMAAANGKVALVSHNTPLTGACPVYGVIDFVGYGTANCSEGSNALAPSNTMAIVRIPCTDRDDNGLDFLTANPDPRNSATPLASCIFPNNIITTTINSPFCVNATFDALGTVGYTAYGIYNTTFTAYLSDASGNFTAPIAIGSVTVNATDPSGSIPVTIPAGTASSQGYKIRVSSNVPAINGSASVYFPIVNGLSDVTNLTANFTETTVTLNWTNPANCFDEIMIVAKAGSAISATPSGDGSGYTADLNFTAAGTAFDGGKVVYKGIMPGQIITSLTAGASYYFKLFTRKGNAWSSGVEIIVMPRLLPAPGEILINQLSPGYAGAADEYIELVNKTNHVFNLADLAIRYQSASGSAGLAGGTLSGTLLARQFWLLSSNASITVGSNVGTARDGVITAGMAASSGQVALVRLSDNVVIDAVGYGTISGGSYTEATPATSPPTTGGLKRKVDGGDTNNNSLDFETVVNSNILLRTRFNAVLQVRFEWVKANIFQQQVQLHFKVVEGKETLHYVVERSINGEAFTKAGIINSITRNQHNNYLYTFIEPKPSGSWVIYRIRAVKTDGTISISESVSLNLNSQEIDLKMVSDRNENLVIKGHTLPGTYQILLYDITGNQRHIQSLQHTGGPFEMIASIKENPPGWYIVKLIKDGVVLYTFKYSIR